MKNKIKLLTGLALLSLTASLSCTGANFRGHPLANGIIRHPATETVLGAGLMAAGAWVAVRPNASGEEVAVGSSMGVIGGAGIVHAVLRYLRLMRLTNRGEEQHRGTFVDSESLEVSQIESGVTQTQASSNTSGSTAGTLQAQRQRRRPAPIQTSNLPLPMTVGVQYSPIPRCVYNLQLRPRFRTWLFRRNEDGYVNDQVKRYVAAAGWSPESSLAQNRQTYT